MERLREIWQMSETGWNEHGKCFFQLLIDTSADERYTSYWVNIDHRIVK